MDYFLSYRVSVQDTTPWRLRAGGVGGSLFHEGDDHAVYRSGVLSDSREPSWFPHDAELTTPSSYIIKLYRIAIPYTYTV